MPTRAAFCVRLDLPDPGDATVLAAAIADGRIARDGLRAVLLKTPGNGLTNDYSRTLAIRAVQAALGDGPAPMLLASGGTEGVAVPHLIALGEAPSGPARLSPGLALGLGAGPAIPAGEHGGPAMSRAVAAALDAAMASASIADPADVALVLVKAPLPPPIAFARTEEAYAALKGACRGAAALGIAAALGEIGWDAAVVGGAAHGRRALVAAGTDVVAPLVLVLGHAVGWGGSLAIATGMLADMLDAPGAAALLARLGLDAAPQLQPEQQARVRAVLTKGEMPVLLRGGRPAALDDSDIHPNRHYRAALSGMLGGLLGDGRIFLSGGAEHQAPEGGVVFSVIVEREEKP